MTDERWKYLMNDDILGLAQDEINEGWHWCLEFDGLLVGPGSSELHCCTCLPADHPVYLTKPPMPDVIINEGDL